MPKDFKDLIEIQHYDTYHYARIVDAMARDPMAYMHDLSEMLSGDGFDYFCEPFDKVSALHKFASIVIDRTFDEDLLGSPTLAPSRSQVFAGAPLYDYQMHVLPVENAFEALNLPHTTFVEFRSARGWPALKPGFERHLYHARRSPCVECPQHESLPDEYNEYFGELQLTGEVEELCDRLAEEVFFVLFANRSFLYDFNHMMASYVTSYASFSSPDEVDPNSIFTSRKDGSSRLRRADTPDWVKTAVEFRERGRCANCKVELGTLRTPIKRAEFDHMVPLAEGGLNDVTNIQLLCHICNNEKGAQVLAPRLLYERWYPA
ncbi:HNH endonuclease [Micromonospora ureilytica]|uniref:HNH endonuclease n=1 Tax=Micromonospora ureilytica TaxID=709868 RepID=UPI002E146813|nr:HNH endonuclease [Micromonospora ureilytica]